MIQPYHLNDLMTFRTALIPAAFVLMSLAGCASYSAHPLDLALPLHRSLGAMNHTLPGGRVIDIGGALSAQDIGGLALLNDPTLQAARAQRNAAGAAFFAAGLLPDPQVGLGFMALLGGPGSAPSITGSISQDIGALITYRVRRASARAGVQKVNADLLWQEWQTLARAETLAVAVYADQQSVQALDEQRRLLGGLAANTQAAVQAGNLRLDESAPSAAALAGVDTALDTARHQLLSDQSALDAMLDLSPDIVLNIAAPDFPAIPAAYMANHLADLAQRRPDLIALQLGYAQSDADLRAAILTQFLPLSLGLTGGSDTSQVNSLGPNVTLNLPIFNGNRGNIAVARATRTQLRVQFTASLAGAQSQAETAYADLAQLDDELQRAADARAAAGDAARQARQAYEGNNIDARSYVDLATAAEARDLEFIALSQRLQTGRIALAGLLGIGLPPVTLADFTKAKP